MDARAPRVLVILPVRDAERTLPHALTEIHEALCAAGYPDHSMVVIDDGSSTDGTAACARIAAATLPVVLVQHPRALGAGRALRTGIAYVTRAAAPEDVVLTTDVALPRATSGLVALVAAIQAGAELAVATTAPRSGSGGAHADANRIYGLLCPLPGIRDYMSPVRGFRARLLQEAVARYGDEGFVSRAGQDAQPELLLRLRALRPRTREIAALQCEPRRVHGALAVGQALALCADAALLALRGCLDTKSSCGQPCETARGVAGLAPVLDGPPARLRPSPTPLLPSDSA